MLETSLKWTPDTFGAVAGSEYFLNVFAFFLIFAGIILDRIGVRRAALVSGFLMVIGASIKLYGISDYFNAGGFGYDFLIRSGPVSPDRQKWHALASLFLVAVWRWQVLLSPRGL